MNCDDILPGARETDRWPNVAVDIDKLRFRDPNVIDENERRNEYRFKVSVDDGWLE